jgi:hypothetical protein
VIRFFIRVSDIYGKSISTGKRPYNIELENFKSFTLQNETVLVSIKQQKYLLNISFYFENVFRPTAHHQTVSTKLRKNTQSSSWEFKIIFKIYLKVFKIDKKLVI